MSDSLPASQPKLFPIQLKRVDVGEITYSCGGFSVSAVNPISDFTFESGFSEITPETKNFQISLGFTGRNDPEKSGFMLDYTLKVRVHGDFSVISDAFPKDKLQQWAQLNGTSILMPFLRETVHSVTVKSGFKPYLIPLVEAQLFKVQAPSPALA
jgi:preprotein translocase subunit SecB